MNCENGRYTGVKRRFQERKVYRKVPWRCNRGHKGRKEINGIIRCKNMEKKEPEQLSAAGSPLKQTIGTVI